MKEKRVKGPKQKKKAPNKDAKIVEKETQNAENDDFDFGGIPKNVSLKRNIGCGG
ncbi:hypothetical protein [Roseivirga sp.]|uniref:hypothetical protein n=1 Tax=Roseivirga sp. TaxID=1964215 RepID=UPI002B26DA25|nr:hypothetical protein [Roseivirga sp.]